MGQRRSLRALCDHLLQEHASPGRLAVAVAVGVVLGCSPFFGLHFWIGLGLALLLRLNKVAVFVGSQISIPPLAPLIGFASVQLGALALSGGFVRLELGDFTLKNLPTLLSQFLLAWLVGGVLVGVALAIPAGLVTLAVVRRRRATRGSTDDGPDNGPDWTRELSDAAALYRDAPGRHHHYARIKYRLDPVYRQVCELLGKRGHVVDLGTGLGMMPVLLARRRQATRVLGVEWDVAKVESGRLAAAGLPAVELVVRDLREHPMDPQSADAVLLVDVLHYFTVEEQGRILEAAAAALRPGGLLVVRETHARARAWLTRLLEGAAVRLGWNQGPGLIFRTEAALRKELTRVGLRCSGGEPSASAVHRGNFLIYGQRLATDKSP